MKKNLADYFKIFISVVMILILIFTTSCSQVLDYKDIAFTEREIKEEYNLTIKNSNGFIQVAENDYLQLYIDGEMAEIKVYDKANDYEIYSNPQNRDTDRIAVNPRSVERLTSQINVSYRDAEGTGYYNSCSDAINYDQFSFEEVDNGVRVNFVFGKKPFIYLAPQIISIERRDEIIDMLDEKDQIFFDSIYRLESLNNYEHADDRALKRNQYPILSERDVYVTGLSSDPTAIGDRQFASTYMMNKIHQIFVSIGYTLEDLERDNTINRATMVSEPDRTVSVSIIYEIDGDSLIASIPRESIYFDRSNIQVTDLTIMPYFGSADESESGYILVPDGSGALIDLNNNKRIYSAYEKKVYSRDKLIYSENISDYDTPVNLPVFGIKADEKAFLGIIEKGDAAASITADISGRTSQNNVAAAKFLINASSERSNQGLSSGLGRKYQSELLQSDLQVRYYFLKGDEANYTGMAKTYRNYLLENDIITQQKIPSTIPLDITTIQSIMYKRSILGVPRDTVLSLTTFEQTKMILEELKVAGVNDIILRVKNWSNNSNLNIPFNTVKLLNEIGGERGFKDLIEYSSDNNIDFYPVANFQYVREHTVFSGFNLRRDAARMLDNTIGYDYQYSVNTFGRTRSLQTTIVSPNYYSQMISGFINKYQAYDNKFLSVGTMGSDLNADYKDNNTVDRQKTVDLIQEQISYLVDEGYNIGVNNGNIYSLKGAAIVFNAPEKSSMEFIFDHSIPFYQLVINGVIPYSGPVLNTSSDYRNDLLRIIEIGAYPSFEWIYEDNDILTDTPNNFYSVNYADWIDKAREAYEILNSTIGQCQDSYIINHEILQRGVVRVKYHNDVVIYINYNDTKVIIDDIAIGPQDYFVTKGE